MIYKPYLVLELDTDYYDKPKVTSAKVVKNKPVLMTREIGFALEIDIPDVFFNRTAPVVKIELPKDLFVTPDPEIAVSITAKSVAEALRLDVKTVEDGLTQMLKDRVEE